MCAEFLSETRQQETFPRWDAIPFRGYSQHLIRRYLFKAGPHTLENLATNRSENNLAVTWLSARRYVRVLSSIP